MNCTPLDQSNGSLLQNVTIGNYTQTVNSDNGNRTTITNDFAIHDNVNNALYHYVLPVICCFGILGNILNLIILSRKSLTVHMERLEKYAHSHLIAQALSDLMYCIAFLPRTFEPQRIFHPSYTSPWLLYDAYHIAVINTFLLSSSWLTVAMAMSRYIAIRYPMQARQRLGMMVTRIDIGIIFILSFLFNVHRYFVKTIHAFPCQEGGYAYFTYDDGELRRSPHAELTYRWIYFVIGIIFPLIALAYCNVFFIRALHTSQKLRRQYSTYSSSSDSSDHSNILTLTLCAIVVLYMLLVVPAEIITFLNDYIKEHFDNHGSDIVFAWHSLSAAICNNMQAFNFAVNFLLYYMINVHFRRVIMNALCCRVDSPRPRRRFGLSSQSHERSAMLSNNSAEVMS